MLTSFFDWCADLALADDAPGLKLRFVSQWGQEFEQLHEGRVDYVIDLAPDIALALPSERLFASDWLCAMRATHPAANLPLTLTRYLAFDHALVSTTGKKEDVQTLFAK